tara:strand:- start:506 stop:1015 length:510 start_codon:yes stop_codon:yes gene_type:complete
MKKASKNNRLVAAYKTKKAARAVSSKPSFAQRLGAFLLEGVKGKIFFSEETGFSDKHVGVFGVLPFLHMNIKEKTFRAMLTNSNGSLKEVLSNKCNEKNLNNVLQKVDYDCDTQSAAGVDAVCMAIMDSINNRYGIRKNGQRRLKEMHGFMSWQVANGKIPASSIEWAK